MLAPAFSGSEKSPAHRAVSSKCFRKTPLLSFPDKFYPAFFIPASKTVLLLFSPASYIYSPQNQTPPQARVQFSHHTRNTDNIVRLIAGEPLKSGAAREIESLFHRVFIVGHRVGRPFLSVHAHAFPIHKLKRVHVAGGNNNINVFIFQGLGDCPNISSASNPSFSYRGMPNAVKMSRERVIWRTRSSSAFGRFALYPPYAA